MDILAIDIGYSNLKLVWGNVQQGPLKTFVRPVGAAPERYLANNLSGDRSGGTAIEVEVDGETYVAGVEPDNLGVWERALHDDYPSTRSYRALFYAALKMVDTSKVDLLVTGLPVSHYYERGRKEKLAQRLCGLHRVDQQTEVMVENVHVIPQPVGAFFDAIVCAGLEAKFEDAEVLVLDPGFFSVDWVLVKNNQVQKRWAGTSHQATSALLEETARLIGEDHFAKVSVTKLESFLRNQKKNLPVRGDRVDIAPYLEKASKTTSELVMNSVLASLRSLKGDINAVVLAGGGAHYYEESVRNLFPGTKVIVPHEPVLTNARGFWSFGVP